MNPRSIVVTPGEPAGIGPDVLLLAFSKQTFSVPLVIIGDRDVLQQRCLTLKLDIHLPTYQFGTTQPISVIDLPFPTTPIPGHPNPDHASILIKALERAVSGCLNGEFAALTTGPVHKACFQTAGIPFMGHTEWLAEQTKSPLPLMLFANPKYRVALMTTHIPLRAVADTLSPSLLTQSLRILHQGLFETFRIPNPRIGVLGLNPHAGEGGYLGDEEVRLIRPTLDQLRQEGLNLIGPLSPDTAFVPSIYDYDAVLSLYHDQALPIMKTLYFTETVNVTLGLPIIRTSVDHGTALDRAGTDQIDERNMIAAIQLAIELAQRGLS